MKKKMIEKPETLNTCDNSKSYKGGENTFMRNFKYKGPFKCLQFFHLSFKNEFMMKKIIYSDSFTVLYCVVNVSTC